MLAKDFIVLESIQIVQYTSAWSIESYNSNYINIKPIIVKQHIFVHMIIINTAIKLFSAEIYVAFLFTILGTRECFHASQ